MQGCLRGAFSIIQVNKKGLLTLKALCFLLPVQHWGVFSTHRPPPSVKLDFSDSMLKGIKKLKLSNKAYIKKECISGAKVSDLIDLVRDSMDTAVYFKILVHVGTNNIFRSDQKLLKKFIVL